ncbi:hypothetical protein K3172_00915 [Qipengyuania sp. 6B39]|uniref:hypothetical protein n=1 Tax=Qipengyuania proteolytica TaxID=2867239 RepID=UPI001C89C517|nr:hypothetical protein [Qipengyuania proteolytica]MBX7494410.1 hypothetical protein [Qipengyuania proteolytica]
MEDGLFTKQGKKLLMVGIFLVVVASLVGGEDNPGLLAEVSEQEAGLDQPPPAYQVPPAGQMAVSQSPVSSPRPQVRQDDSALDAWYASAAPVEPLDPQPVDESHLIDDTQPFVSAEPEVR